MLVLPVLNDIFHVVGFGRVDENRSFKTTLELNLQRLDDFPEDADAYVNDNFAFRGPFLEVFHRTKYTVFGVSPSPDKTIVGKEGYFFNAGKDLDIYLGKLDLSEEQLSAFSNEWQQRSAYFDSLGITCYWLVPPLKHNVYPDFLPNSVVRRKTPTRVQVLKDHFSDEFPSLIIDPSAAFQHQRSKTKLYYTLDNHWTYMGGEIAYELLLNEIKDDFPTKNIPLKTNPNWESNVNRKGIHRRVMGVPELEELEFVPDFENATAVEVEKYGFEPPLAFAYPENFEFRYINPSIEKGSGLRALIVRDSFGKQMIPFLSQSFEESLFIFDGWQFKADREIIETMQPDIIIYVSVESLLEEFIIKR